MVDDTGNVTQLDMWRSRSGHGNRHSYLVNAVAEVADDGGGGVIWRYYFSDGRVVVELCRTTCLFGSRHAVPADGVDD